VSSRLTFFDYDEVADARQHPTDVGRVGFFEGLVESPVA
jgi:hypothetical protein